MIDYWCNAFTPDRAELWAAVIEAGDLTIRTTGADAAGTDDGFASVSDMATRMDRLGVTTIILPVCGLAADAPLTEFGHYALRPAEITDMATSHPHHFCGMFSVDPTAGAADVAAAAEALDQPWCVALHSHTHSWGLGFDHAAYRDYYELCRRRSVPFVMQAGASGGHFAHDAGHPAAIETPARAFPDVHFVLSHTGAPWITETIAACSTHPNVALGTATYPPRRWSRELVAFLSGPGREQCLFGTGFPLTGHARALRQLDALDLTDEVRQGLLAGNARRLFTRIPDRPGD